MINNILGKNIYLREVQYSDSKKIVKWRNDDNIGKYLTRKKLTLTKQKLFIEEYVSVNMLKEKMIFILLQS